MDMLIVNATVLVSLMWTFKRLVHRTAAEGPCIHRYVFCPPISPRNTVWQ